MVELGMIPTLGKIHMAEMIYPMPLVKLERYENFTTNNM